MGTVSDRRWPVAPLMKELGVTTPGELAVACGVDDRAAERAMSCVLSPGIGTSRERIPRVRSAR